MHNGDPKDLVRRSYDRISCAYRGDSVNRNWRCFAWLETLTPLLQPGDAILDLGCGCGILVVCRRHNQPNQGLEPTRGRGVRLGLSCVPCMRSCLGV